MATQKKPCKNCERTRLLLVIVTLTCMAAVLYFDQMGMLPDR
jgi:hypothetical protein